MTARLLAIDLVLLAFGALSALAVWEFGYVGVWMSILDTSASMQVGADLVISCSIALGFIVRDARKLGLNPWPWVVAAVFTGSFAPLGYLAWREWNRAPAAAPAAA